MNFQGIEMKRDWKSELNGLRLEEAVNTGNFEEVHNICSPNGLDDIETSELVALAQIKHLTKGRGLMDKEVLPLLKCEELSSYLLLDKSSTNSLVTIIGSLNIPSQKEAITELMDALETTIEYHVESWKGWIDNRRASIDFLLSNSMETAVSRYAKDKGFSKKVAQVVSMSYHAVLLSSAREFIPLKEMRDYVQKLEKWIHYATTAYKESIEGGKKSYIFTGGLDYTIRYLGMTTKESYERLREVVDTTMDIAKRIYGDIDMTSKQVAKWLSYVPDDEDKTYIREDMLNRYGLNAQVLDDNTTPTEVFIEERIKHPLQQWMDYGSEEWLNVLVERVQTDGNRNEVASAMLSTLEQATDKYDLNQIKKMAPYGNQLYNDQAVSNGFKEIVLSALQHRDLGKIRLLAPLVKTLYQGEEAMPDLATLLAPK